MQKNYIFVGYKKRILTSNKKHVEQNKNKKHPKGLGVLFFTEMWERFGFYLMLGIFTLYMVAGDGMGLSNAESADIYGTYLALVYLTPFFGGLLADKLLGYRKSIFIGGLLMAGGYFGLAFTTSIMGFFGSLLFIILGNGLFKPNISVLLGRLYDDDEHRHLKDSGFNIFYMGINVGAFICNFVAAYLRLEFGWGYAFAVAGAGMLIGVVWLFAGQKIAPKLVEVDTISPSVEGDMTLGQILLKMFVPAIIAGGLGWLIPGSIFGSDSTDAFLFFSIPVVLFYINLVRKAKEEEKEPIKALLAIMGVVVIFWAIFHQNGSALTFWTQNNTDRQVSETTASLLKTIKLSEEVSTVPRISEKQGLHGEFEGYNLGPSYYFINTAGEPYKDMVLPKGNLSNEDAPSDLKKYFPHKKEMAEQIAKFEKEIKAANADDKKEIEKRYAAWKVKIDYIKSTSEKFTKSLAEETNATKKAALDKKYATWQAEKDKLLAELAIAYEGKAFDWAKVRDDKKGTWGSFSIWPTELQASINPFFIIILTPLVVGFLNFLGKRGKEPSTPAKIGIGLLITALSMFVMVGAAIVSESGAIKTSTAWLFGLYGVITVGELFLSPMGLSLVSKLSPKRIGAVMMGGWFLSTAIGNKLSGVLSGTWDLFDNKEYFFLTNMGLVMIAVVGIFVMLPWLRKVVEEHTEK